MLDDLTIIFQDDAIIVIDKPGGLLAVPGRGPEKQDCVVRRLRSRFSDLPEQPAVHRLDMHTSGVMVIARRPAAHRNLSLQFAQRRVEKRYIALLEGTLSADSGTIELKFRLDPDNRPYQVYDPLFGKVGITRWRTIGGGDSTTRVEFVPLTGRTHQLRLHAAHPRGLHAPIVGDALYGTGGDGSRMCLHATYLAFSHPDSADWVEFSSPAPF